MNYIWNILLKTDGQNIKRENITFKCAKSYSPYMEGAFENLNASEIDENLIVELNPYYRFFAIFKNLFKVDYEENLEFREVLFDILIHFLGDIDLKQGITKQEYYKKYVLQDILQNVFSDRIKNNIQVFRKRERDIVLASLISMYTTGTSLELFKKVVNRIFPRSTVYINQDSKKEILIYIGEIKTQEKEEKIETLIELFLYIDKKVALYWQYHFGIIGMEETMKVNQMVLY